MSMAQAEKKLVCFINLNNKAVELAHSLHFAGIKVRIIHGSELKDDHTNGVTEKHKNIKKAHLKDFA